MSNRAYLDVTTFRKMPSSGEWKEFYPVAAELEAADYIPLFWLCMFDESDLAVASVDTDYDSDEGEPYAYLIAPAVRCHEHLRDRRSLIRSAVNDGGLALYDDWTEKVAGWLDLYILIRTEELSWLDGGASWGRKLRSSLRALNTSVKQGSFVENTSFEEVTGVFSPTRARTMSRFELVGLQNASWPPPLADEVPQGQASIGDAPVAKKTSRWRFWR